MTKTKKLYSSLIALLIIGMLTVFTPKSDIPIISFFLMLIWYVFLFAWLEAQILVFRHGKYLLQKPLLDMTRPVSKRYEFPCLFGCFGIYVLFALISAILRDVLGAFGGAAADVLLNAAAIWVMYAVMTRKRYSIFRKPKSLLLALTVTVVFAILAGAIVLVFLAKRHSLGTDFSIFGALNQYYYTRRIAKTEGCLRTATVCTLAVFHILGETNNPPQNN